MIDWKIVARDKNIIRTNSVRRLCKLWYAGMRRMTSEELRKRDDTVINIFCNEVVAFCSGNTRVLHRVASANTQLGHLLPPRRGRGRGCDWGSPRRNNGRKLPLILSRNNRFWMQHELLWLRIHHQKMNHGSIHRHWRYRSLLSHRSPSLRVIYVLKLCCPSRLPLCFNLKVQGYVH